MGDLPGVLYLVGTPIGNLEDITLRALRALREVSLIAAEDTRVTRVLLQRHGIQTPVLSYHARSGPGRLAQLVELLRSGKDIALVSDAGMPGVSDPGAQLVSACARAGLPVTVVPGPTAVSSALALSGVSAREFCFLGFLPRRPAARREALRRSVHQPAPLVVFEAPHRLRESLEDMLDLLGDRPAACCRELTKKFEEVVRGSLSELIAHFSGKAPRGEFTIIVAGAPPGCEKADVERARVEVRELIQAGLSASRAAAHVARWRGVPKRLLYSAGVEEREPHGR